MKDTTMTVQVVLRIIEAVEFPADQAGKEQLFDFIGGVNRL